jgi:asparagine synthase (glutamine-hydrolysing)
MCGICGFYHKKNVSKNELKLMNRTLNYRGPDDEGYFIKKINDSYQLGLAHNRLSIIDLSKNGHQPMFSFDKNIIVSYNGEIYNYKEIKRRLKMKDYKFKSETDTEVIIYAYKEWGIDCIKQFNGMFAISIYDKLNDILYLVRDRMGIKPLYYYKKGNDLVFGSELKPIMKYPFFKKSINFNSLNMFLHHGYITAPNTIFKNTYKLNPGSYLKIENNNIEEMSYWDIKNKFINRNVANKKEKFYIKELDKIITDSIDKRMISDVSLGAFLSGGIDSSLVVSIMQKLSSKPVNTFTIGFNEDKYNEAHHAKRVANHLGTNHHELYLPITKAQELIEQIPIYYDEPFADSSQLATMLVSRLAKKNVTVSLSGDGGDELFCGYNRYNKVLKLKKYKILSYFFQFFKDDDLGEINRKLLKLKFLNKDNNIVNSDYLASEFFLNNLIKQPFKFESKYFDILNLTSDIQEKNMLQDLITYLPDDILTKVDRASMAYSLESRTPLLDHRIVEFAFNLPHNLKYKNSNLKYILKKLLYKYIPKKIVNRPKQGFGVPIYDWLRNDLDNYVNYYLSEEFIYKQKIFNYEEVVKLVKRFKNNQSLYVDKLVWNIIVFQLWYKKYIS